MTANLRPEALQGPVNGALADRQISKRFVAFMDASPDVVFSMSPDWSQMRYLDGHGFLAPPGDGNGSWLEHYAHPDDHARVAQAIRDAISAKGLFAVEHRVLSADGRAAWAMTRAAPVLSEDGEVVEWCGVATDITRRKVAEKALDRIEQDQAFLLHARDALRGPSGPAAVQRAACWLLAEYLGADSAHWVEQDADRGARVVSAGRRPGRTSGYDVRAIKQEMGAALLEAFDGDTFSVTDVTTSSLLPGAARAGCLEMEIGAFIAAPVTQDARPEWALVVVNRVPREWTSEDVSVVEKMAALTLDGTLRAGAFMALRAAEAREREQRLFGEGLRDTAAELSSTLLLQDVLEHGVLSARRLIQYDAAYVVLASSGAIDHLHAEGLTSDEQQELQQWHRELPSMAEAPLYRHGELTGLLRLISDRETAESLFPLRPVHALMVMPLARKGVALGYLVLVRRWVNGFGTVDKNLLEAFAYQLVTAIQNATLFLYTQEVVALQERQQFARDLHDAVSQSLFTAGLLVQRLLRLARGDERMHELLPDVNVLIKGAQAEMRGLLLELRPLNLQSTPLAQLFTQLVEALRGRKRMNVIYELEGEPRVPAGVHLVVYRIVQEALNNVTRHAGATEARVRVRGDDGVVEVLVHDNGAGFDASSPATGLGLQMMRERAGEIDALLMIESRIGSGTSVHILWPRAEKSRFEDWS